MSIVCLCFYVGMSTVCLCFSVGMSVVCLRFSVGMSAVCLFQFLCWYVYCLSLSLSLLVCLLSVSVSLLICVVSVSVSLLVCLMSVCFSFGLSVVCLFQFLCWYVYFLPFLFSVGMVIVSLFNDRISVLSSWMVPRPSPFVPKHQIVLVDAAGFGDFPSHRVVLWSPLAFAFFTRKREAGKGR